jgi:7-cyano-7-deazaguanine synthase
MTAKKPAIVLVSGGLDSCVTAAVARQEYALAFFHADYGQRTLRRERQAFRDLADFFQPEHTLEVDLAFLGALGGSSLTDQSLPVPMDDAGGAGLPSTYVPFRNTILIAAAVAWAEVIGAGAIFIGANMIDGPGYPDTRPEYYEAYNRLIELGTGPATHIRLHTPLIHLDKAGIVRLGHELQAPFHLTWSCYQNDDRACGRCSSCRLRLEGFARAGLADPIPYESPSRTG